MKNENETVLKTNEGRVNELLALFIGFDLFDKFISVDGVSRVKYKYLNSKGKPEHPYYGPFYPEQMSFNTSFDWLMPVWAKFRDLAGDTYRGIEHQMMYINIVQKLSRQISRISIEEFFKQMVLAVKWHNSIIKP